MGAMLDEPCLLLGAGGGGSTPFFTGCRGLGCRIQGSRCSGRACNGRGQGVAGRLPRKQPGKRRLADDLVRDRVRS
jgi:hypothetical protein